MCLLIVAPEQFPDDEVLAKGEEKFGWDGIGVAWRQNGLVHWRKGITLEQLKAIGKDTKGPWLIHFRQSTVGKAMPELCHPFPVNKDVSLKLEGKAMSVLAHNGHWNNWANRLLNSLGKHELPDGPWSDTRAMAFLTAIHGREYMKLVDHAETGDFGRIAILSNTGPVFMMGRNWSKYKDLHVSVDIGWYMKKKSSNKTTSPWKDNLKEGLANWSITAGKQRALQTNPVHAQSAFSAEIQSEHHIQVAECLEDMGIIEED